MSEMRAFRDVTHLLGELVKFKLLIDPLISGMQDSVFCEDARTVIRETKEKIVRKLYTELHARNAIQAEVFGDVPMNDTFVHACIDDFIVGTAVYLSHDFYGEVNVDLNIAQMATIDVGTFIDKYGLANLCWCYATIVGYENHQAIDYYGRLSVTDFVSGVKHRPWALYSLQYDLEMGLAQEIYRTIHDTDIDYVELTDVGRKRMREERRMLEESGYINHRMNAMFLSQFDHLQEDYEVIADRIAPSFMTERKNFLDFAGITEGMEILEIGCGTGALTFDAGLADRVGKNGLVVAIDPSLGMLHQAQMKLDALEYQNVTLDGARVEDISYGDEEFDAVLGVACFHFTDQEKAIKKMIQVTRIGGTIALFNPLNVEDYPPFYREWFHIFFEIADLSGTSNPSNYLPEPGELKGLFERHGLSDVEEKILSAPVIYNDPVNVVNYFVRGVGLFQRQLLSLPWSARNDLVQQLIEKGKEICNRYTLEELTIPFPAVFVKGTITKK